MNRREYRDILFNSSLTPLEKLTYAYLRSCADWETHIVGDADKKLISYTSIHEHLEYISPPRSNNKSIDVSRDQIKRILSRLTDCGFIARLPGQRYGIELRFFLPLASTGKVYSQEARHMRAIGARHSQTQQRQGVQGKARHTESTQARHTSVLLLSQSNYIYYRPDESDWKWLGFFAGKSARDREKERGLETEKFNLHGKKKSEYNLNFQREDWRTWMVRWVDYREAKHE